MPFFGTPQTTQQIPAGFSQQQTSALNQLLQTGLGGLQGIAGGVGQNQFAPIAEQQTRQFHEQTVPSLAERFISMPGEGGLRSSGFQQALGQAGAGLHSNLAALESQFGQQQRGQDIGLLQNMLQMGLTQQTTPGIQPAQEGGLSSALTTLLPMLLPLILSALGGTFGGPAGAAAGGAAGGAAQSGTSSLLSSLKGG